MPTTLLVIEQPIAQPDLEYVLSLHGGDGDGAAGDSADGGVGGGVGAGGHGAPEAAELQRVQGDAAEKYVVVVPVGKESGKVLAVLDDIALADFEGAAEDSHDEPEAEAVVLARRTMEATVKAFQDAGREAVGELLTGKVVSGLKNVAERHAVDEIIVLTLPHLVEEFLHRDLASRLRKATDLPTLRLLAHVPLR